MEGSKEKLCPGNEEIDLTVVGSQPTLPSEVLLPGLRAIKGDEIKKTNPIKKSGF